MSAVTKWKVLNPAGIAVVTGKENRGAAVDQAFDPRFGMGKNTLDKLRFQNRRVAGWGYLFADGWRVEPDE